MNADAFRHFYDYHFAENRSLWNAYVMRLSDEQFTQEVNYSHGSVRNHIVHLMSVDDTWFSGLRGVEIPETLEPAQFTDRQLIRAHWDEVERKMRDYLTALRDEMLFTKPLDGEDKNLLVWQVLLHVVNQLRTIAHKSCASSATWASKLARRITSFTSTTTRSAALFFDQSR